MSYADAHIHLADLAYAGKLDQVLADAHHAGVQRMLSSAVDYETSLGTIHLAQQYPQLVLAAIGLHPSTVVYKGNAEQARLEALLKENKARISAIGEIGLDGKYTQDKETLRLQKETLNFFLELAESLHLPVVVHSRYAVEEVFNELSRFNLPRVILHWYDGPTENFKMIQNRGYLISIGPAVAYSNRISEVARKADLNMILTETDGPVSHRGPFEGKMTSPSFVVDVVQKLAEVKSVKTELVREAVWRNFERLKLEITEKP